MELSGSRSPSTPALSTTWSTAAGLYMLGCAAVLLVATRQVTSLVAELLVLPTGSSLWLAVPVPVLGAGLWWLAVERRGSYTYPLAVAVGLATALLTTLGWLLWGVSVWGLDGVAAGWPLVVVVIVPVVPAGLVVGIPLMYARRRFGGGTSEAP